MAHRITSLRAHDIRFPTSDELHGSDAMNPDPDYSAAVAIVETDDPELSGHGLTFTIGRGTEICTSAIRAFESHVVGRDLDRIHVGRAEPFANISRGGVLGIGRNPELFKEVSQGQGP